LPAPRCQLLLLVTITTSDCCFLLLWFLTQHAMAVSTNIVAAVDCCFHNILFIVAVAVMLPSPKATGCCFYSNTTTVSTVTPPLFLQLSSLPLDCCFCSKNVHCRHQLIVDSVALLSQPNSIAVQCAGAGAAIVAVASLLTALVSLSKSLPFLQLSSPPDDCSFHCLCHKYIVDCRSRHIAVLAPSPQPLLFLQPSSPDDCCLFEEQI